MGLHFELSNMPGESTNPWGQSWAGITLGQYGARSAARGSRAESGLLGVADPERAETYRVSILNGSNGAKILARALLNAASNTAWSPYLQFGCLEFQAFNRSPGSLRSDFAVTNIANSRSLSRTVNSLFSNNLLLAAVYLRLSSLAGTKGSTLSTSRDSAGGVCPWPLHQEPRRWASRR